MGAIVTRLSLRPLLQKVGEIDANLGHIEPRERGHLASCLKIESQSRNGASQILHRRPSKRAAASADPGPIAPGTNCLGHNCLGQMADGFLQQPRPVVMAPAFAGPTLRSSREPDPIPGTRWTGSISRTRIPLW